REFVYFPEAKLVEAFGIATEDNSSGCDVGRSDATPTLVWGDSFAWAIWPAVVEAIDARGGSARLRWYPRCPPLVNTNLLRNGQPFEACADHNNAVIERYMASATPQAN